MAKDQQKSEVKAVDSSVFQTENLAAAESAAKVAKSIPGNSQIFCGDRLYADITDESKESDRAFDQRRVL